MIRTDSECSCHDPEGSGFQNHQLQKWKGKILGLHPKSESLGVWVGICHLIKPEIIPIPIKSGGFAGQVTIEAGDRRAGWSCRPLSYFLWPRRKVSWCPDHLLHPPPFFSTPYTLFTCPQLVQLHSAPAFALCSEILTLYQNSFPSCQSQVNWPQIQFP